LIGLSDNAEPLEVKVTRGKFHNSLGMILDYSEPGQVIVDMTQYVEEMIKGFPSESLKEKKVSSPWNEYLFTVQDDSARLLSHRSELFHTIVAQGQFYASGPDPICAQQ
jgi:hypothetical protein